MDMKDRIQRFLQSENKSYAQFAEEIGVQASGISHILSGRNNPSLDFVLKMLSKYPALSSEWLLFGRGSMYKTISQPTLFDNDESLQSNIVGNINTGAEISGSDEVVDRPKEMPEEVTSEKKLLNEKRGVVIEKVLFIYSDKTFTEYTPS